MHLKGHLLLTKISKSQTSEIRFKDLRFFYRFGKFLSHARYPSNLMSLPISTLGFTRILLRTTGNDVSPGSFFFHQFRLNRILMLAVFFYCWLHPVLMARAIVLHLLDKLSGLHYGSFAGGLAHGHTFISSGGSILQKRIVVLVVVALKHA